MTHSYTNRSDFRPNFEQHNQIFLKFLGKIDPFIYQILHFIRGHSYTKRLISLLMLAAHPHSRDANRVWKKITKNRKFISIAYKLRADGAKPPLRKIFDIFDAKNLILYAQFTGSPHPNFHFFAILYNFLQMLSKKKKKFFFFFRNSEFFFSYGQKFGIPNKFGKLASLISAIGACVLSIPPPPPPPRDIL